jgi:hypothetical protein
MDMRKEVTTHLGNLDNVQEEGERVAVEGKMDSPHDECAMIRRSPHVCGETKLAGVFLEQC